MDEGTIVTEREASKPLIEQSSVESVSQPWLKTEWSGLIPSA